MSTKHENDRLIRVQALSQTYFNMRISKPFFVSFSSPQKEKKLTQSATTVLTLWIHRTEDEVKLHFGLAR